MCGAGAVTLAPGWGLLGLLVALPFYAAFARDRNSDRFWLGLATIVYLAALLSLTFFPLPLPPYAIFDTDCPFVYTRPFGTIGLALGRGLDSSEMAFLVGNLIAFIPVGALVPLLRPGERPLGRVLLAGLVLSAAIEVGQLAASLAVGFPYRQADVDDVIVNTIGAALGYGLLQILRRASGNPLASDRRLE